MTRLPLVRFVPAMTGLFWHVTFPALKDCAEQAWNDPQVRFARHGGREEPQTGRRVEVAGVSVEPLLWDSGRPESGDH